MKRSYEFDALRGTSKKLCHQSNQYINIQTSNNQVLEENFRNDRNLVEAVCQEVGGFETSNYCNSSSNDDVMIDEPIEIEPNQEHQEEYEFLKDFYSHESSKYGENDLLSNHSFQSVERIVTDVKLEKIMRKLLRFAVKAKLSESSLESVLDLFKETLQDFDSISEKDSYYFTLKGFYDYFYISRKTIMVHYCTTCGEYERNKNVKKCNCDIEWKNHSYCFLRPLKFQLDERIFFQKDFNDQFFEQIEDVKDGIISDRIHGSVYQQHHKKLVNEGKLRTVSAFFDSVCPFNNSTNAFYQGSFNFNEMKAHLRRKRSNNFLWILAPKKPDLKEVQLLLKILMDDLNHYNSLTPVKIRLERIVCDLPARSEVLLFKQSGKYFCHLCREKGITSRVSETTKQTRYPLNYNKFQKKYTLNELRSLEYWDENMNKKEFEGMKGISPILKQDWNPNPSIICCYDSMHALYEGLFQDLMSLIPESYWEKFDKIFLKQKYPSFLHKHPRKITNGKTMNKLRAIEVYMICHYYMEIFNHIGDISSIIEYVNMIVELSRIVDTLTDSFELKSLDSLELELLDLLHNYQNIVGEKKATPNFHIVSDLIQSCKMYGPLAHNSAFIGEGLNFTLSKTYICSNSARYSIMYFDMCQLCDILDLGEDLNKGQCIFGNYVISKKRDYIAHLKSGKIYQIESFSDDYNIITLKSVKSDRLLVVERKDIDKYLPCVQLSLPKKEIYTKVHKNTFQYL